jgi:hypothetical protein
MSRHFFAIASLASTLCIGTSFGASTATTATTTAPVAFVYVTSNYTGHANRILGYSVASNGKLTPTPYSPYSHDVVQMAVNGKYLFAAGNNSTSNDIYTFSVGPHGYLTPVATANVSKFPGSTCASVGTLNLDRTGVTLYPFIYNADCSGTDDAYMSLAVANTTGKLTYLSETQPYNSNNNPYYGYPLTFIANNQLAYNVACDFSLASIMGLRRESNGSLMNISIDANYPAAPAGEGYCPTAVAADTTNHLAMAMEGPFTAPGGSTHYQIASYTVNTTNGNLTTANTYKNMPSTSVAGVNSMKYSGVYTLEMSPSGKLLAVGGSTGLQIFHFNGASPVTVGTGRLTTDEINQVAWDNSNHLYAIAPFAGKLFVFTVTSTSVVQAPGSPYNITQPQTLAVQPK